MFIVNNIAYAGTKADEMLLTAVKPLDDFMMLLTFSSGETRLYDAMQLLSLPAFLPLKNDEVFKNAVLDHGVVTWADGEIDIAPETMYQNSYPYKKEQIY